MCSHSLRILTLHGFLTNLSRLQTSQSSIRSTNPKCLLKLLKSIIRYFLWIRVLNSIAFKPQLQQALYHPQLWDWHIQSEHQPENKLSCQTGLMASLTTIARVAERILLGLQSQVKKLHTPTNRFHIFSFLVSHPVKVRQLMQK